MSDSVTATVARTPVDPATFRSLMTMHPAGVAVVTTVAPDGAPRGMTCSSVCSVSLRPPTLLVCLSAGSRTLAALLEASAFAVNLLHDKAEPAANLFATDTPDRFEKVEWAREPDRGLPHLIEDAHTTEGNDYLTPRQVIQHHNATLTGISSFGPRVHLVSSEALQIGA